MRELLEELVLSLEDLRVAREEDNPDLECMAIESVMNAWYDVLDRDDELQEDEELDE